MYGDIENISTYFFGYVTIKSEFQQLFIKRYLNIIEYLRAIRNDKLKITLQMLGENIQKMCRYAESDKQIKKVRDILRRNIMYNVHIMEELAIGKKV